MYIFKEIKINKNVAIRNYSSSDNKYIKLNEWGIWVKINLNDKSMTKEEKAAAAKITTRCQGVVPNDIIEGGPETKGIIAKYGCAEITQDKSNRSVNVLAKYKHNVKINFNFKQYLNDKSVYSEPKQSNMFDIDVNTLPKSRHGIPILS